MTQPGLELTASWLSLPKNEFYSFSRALLSSLMHNCPMETLWLWHLKEKLIIKIRGKEGVEVNCAGNAHISRLHTMLFRAEPQRERAGCLGRVTVRQFHTSVSSQRTIWIGQKASDSLAFSAYGDFAFCLWSFLYITEWGENAPG